MVYDCVSTFSDEVFYTLCEIRWQKTLTHNDIHSHTHLNRGAFFHIRIQYFKICIGSLSLSFTVLKRVFYTIDSVLKDFRDD